MENRNNVEDSIKNALKNGAKSPSHSLWDKVNSTLDKEAKKRKKLFYFRLALGLFIPLLLVFIFIQLDGKQESETINNGKETITSEVKNENNASKNYFSNSDSLQQKNKNLESNAATEIDEDEKSSIIAESRSEKIETSKVISKKTQKSKHDSMEDYKIKSTYYYYNSDNNKHIKTHDKTVIDSLVRASKSVQDSL